MKELFKSFTFNPYKAFFIAVCAFFTTILLGAAGIVMFNDTEHGNPYIIYPIATLMATTFMMHLGAANPSAKDVFWA